MATDIDLATAFDNLLLAMLDTGPYPPSLEFELGDVKVPEQLRGWLVFSTQFQNPGPTLVGSTYCFVSRLQVTSTSEYTVASCFVVEVEYRFRPFQDAWVPTRWFLVSVAFDATGEIVPALSVVKLFEDGEEQSDFAAPPLPQLPGPLGNAVDIASWGIELGQWISEVLPDDWGALGLVLSQVADVVLQATASADAAADGEVDLATILQTTTGLQAVLSATGTFSYESGHGYCLTTSWEGATASGEARVYRPTVDAGAASVTIITKVDRKRNLFVDDDHLVVSITIDYDGHVIGVMSAWKFVDASPEEGELAVADGTDNVGCYAAWQIQIGQQFGTPLPTEFTRWFTENWLDKWVAAVDSASLVKS
jgi:hypothetical protein